MALLSSGKLASGKAEQKPGLRPFAPGSDPFHKHLCTGGGDDAGRRPAWKELRPRQEVRCSWCAAEFMDVTVGLAHSEQEEAARSGQASDLFPMHPRAAWVLPELGTEGSPHTEEDSVVLQRESQGQGAPGTGVLVYQSCAGEGPETQCLGNLRWHRGCRRHTGTLCPAGRAAGSVIAVLVLLPCVLLPPRD